MSAHIDYQVIKQGGKPAFAVVPYDEFMELLGERGRPTIPHEVVEMVIKQEYSLLRAWREYKHLTQAEMAARLGVTQEAVAQQEAPGKRLRKATIEKWATALELDQEQLRG